MTSLTSISSNAQPLTALLAACEAWHKWAAADHAGIAPWTDGPVALIGDAAHASLPYLAQGAAMALEDAVVLGQSCIPDKDVATAFRDFELKRKPRTHRVIQTSRRMGRAYHLTGAVAAMRNAAISTLPGLTNPVRQDWLYGWRP